MNFRASKLRILIKLGVKSSDILFGGFIIIIATVNILVNLYGRPNENLLLYTYLTSIKLSAMINVRLKNKRDHTACYITNINDPTDYHNFPVRIYVRSYIHKWQIIKYSR